MRCERLRLTAEAGEIVAPPRQLVPGGESVSDAVAGIIARVRAKGDQAVLDYSREFDGAEPRSLEVGEDELSEAAESLDPELRRSLDAAIANVRQVASA